MRAARCSLVLPPHKEKGSAKRSPRILMRFGLIQMPDRAERDAEEFRLSAEVFVEIVGPVLVAEVIVGHIKPNVGVRGNRTLNACAERVAAEVARLAVTFAGVMVMCGDFGKRPAACDIDHRIG